MGSNDGVVMQAKLSRDQLLELLEVIMKPKGKGFTAEQVDQMLYTFCAGSPDPAKAMWLIVECTEPLTNEELVDRALSMPLRRVADVPTSEMPAAHPLRSMAE